MRPPSVDALARELADTGLPHPLLVDAARQAIESGNPGQARHLAELSRRRMLVPVINATGVLLHTNLGRAPLGRVPASGYTNLELDLDTGHRGSRSAHVAALLARAAGAEAALVVNNGAAAVLLSLAAVAGDSAVAVSRGEMVEIGGGFRIPEVIAAAGSRLVEVGATNRTRRSDYERAAVAAADAGSPLGAILKVHPSNYRVVGFAESTPVRELAAVGPPVVVDVGSGLLDEATPWLTGGPPAWLRGEPGVAQTLRAGAALVTFSGDKLLGGPQAGIIAGSRELVTRCAVHPLARALRPGGLVLAALQDVALAYLRGQGARIAFWAMASTPVVDLRARAIAIAADVAGWTVIDTEALPGAGSTPGMTIESVGLRHSGDHAAALRAMAVPVIARRHDGATIVDLRTVAPDDDEVVARSLAALDAAAY